MAIYPAIPSNGRARLPRERRARRVAGRVKVAFSRVRHVAVTCALRVPRLNAVTRQRGALCCGASNNRLTGGFALPKIRKIV